MNWPFWSLSRPAQLLNCESIEPLLSLYADGMASPEEVRHVETHLPDCADCREALSWMQATHRTLAARPVAIPPANLHSRIALAIAASSAAPIKLTPARSFTLRPSYAAAASLTIFGLVLSYSLWHSPPETSVKPAPRPTHMASVPQPAVKSLPHSIPGRLPHSVKVKSLRPLVAANAPVVVRPAVKRLPIVRKAEPIPQDRVASNVPIHTAPLTHLVPLHVKTPGHALPPHHLMASSKIVPTETRHLPITPEKAIAPKLSVSPLVANNHTQEPVTVHILPPTVTVQSPVVQTASATSAASPNFGGILGPVNAHFKQIGQMRNVSYATRFTVRQSNLGATNVMHALDNEHFAYQDGIHSP